MPQWTTKDTNSTPDFAELFKEDYAVLLLRGKNNFGDHIYSYVKISLPNMKRLYEDMSAGRPFNPSDFGEVVAAGTGEPSPDVEAEVAAAYPVIGKNASSNVFQGALSDVMEAPPPKKAWDEY